MLSKTVPTLLSHVPFLRTTDFLQHIGHEAFLESLAEEMEEQIFGKNQVILHRGDRDQLIYFIVEGKVKIHVGDIKMAELSRGAHFGDINLFDSQPASASATALQVSRCLILHQSRLLATLEKYSDIRTELIANLYQRQHKVHALTWQTSTPQAWSFQARNPSWAY